MSLSHQDLDIIHDAALGVIRLYDDRILDIIDRPGIDRELVYKKMLLDDSLSGERSSELEREIIWEYLEQLGFEWMWDFDHGYLRHRFIAEGMGERGKKEGWFIIPDSSIGKVCHYLSDDYSPTGDEPAAEAVLLYLVKNCDYKRAQSSNLMSFIEMGLFDSLSITSKEEVLRFIINDYLPGENGPCSERVIYAWIKRGLLSGFPEECIQKLKLKEWVNARPDIIDYMEAGFWEVLSTHEKALMIAPFLDKADAVLVHLSDLKELSDLNRLLRLETDTPLLSEASYELYRINAVYSSYSPNLYIK